MNADSSPIDLGARTDSQLLDRVLAEFEEAWQQGQPPIFDRFLVAYSGAQRLRILCELVHSDLERRLQAGETARIETYLEHHEELADDSAALLELIRWEFQLRNRQEPDLSANEYQQRFPRLRDEIGRLLSDVRSGLASASTLTSPVAGGAATGLPQVPGYKVQEEIGHGGMGIVYKALQLSHARTVALKVILRERMTHPESLRRFRREIQAALRLRHPNIVQVLDANQSEQMCYLAMEYIEGENLATLVERRGRRPVWQACRFIRDTALGLQHAFECGMVHRDIKPSNLMAMGDPGGIATVKILDMGLARIDSADNADSFSTLTQQGALLGTIDYIAPEQAQNPHSADIRSDLYSLGCTFYFLLMGRPPFAIGRVLEKLDKHRWVTPRPVDKLRLEVPRVVAAVVDRLLAKKPEERYQTPAELAAALQPYCDAAGCAAARAAQVPRPSVAPAKLPEKDKAFEAVKAPPQPVGEVRRCDGHKDWVWSVAISSDGKQILSGSRDHSLRLWDAKSGQAIRSLDGHEREVRCVALTRDGRRAISGGADRSVRLWDFQTGLTLRVLTGHEDMVKSVAISADGRRALSAGNDRRVVQWDLDLGRKIRSLKGHTGDINGVTFHPNGQLAVSGGWDKTLRVWDLASGKELQRRGGTFSAFQWSVFMGLTFHPDGRLLVASSDHTLCLLDVDTGNVVQRFEGHTGWVSSVALSPNGQHALSGSWDGTVRLWDVATGKQTACFEGHTDQVHSVAFAPDGVHAVSGSADSSLRCWRVLT